MSISIKSELVLNNSRNILIVFDDIKLIPTRDLISKVSEFLRSKDSELIDSFEKFKIKADSLLGSVEFYGTPGRCFLPIFKLPMKRITQFFINDYLLPKYINPQTDIFKFVGVIPEDSFIKDTISFDDNVTINNKYDFESLVKLHFSGSYRENYLKTYYDYLDFLMYFIYKINFKSSFCL